MLGSAGHRAEDESSGREPRDPFALDAYLRRLNAERDRRDEVIGRLALLSRRQGLWRRLGWSSFEGYCTERLGLSARNLRQRIWLERRLEHLPPLRAALRGRTVTYSKALVLARACDASTIEAGLADAEGRPCLDLQRELEAEEDRQMCARPPGAGGPGVRVFGPPEFFGLLEEALCAAQELAVAQGGAPIGPAEALTRLAEHFVEVWTPLVSRPVGRRRRVLARTRGLCAAPGCSRSADHLHHLRYRSQGGDDTDENLVGLCASHHLRGVHQGRVRVRRSDRPGGRPGEGGKGGERGSHGPDGPGGSKDAAGRGLEWQLGLHQGQALSVLRTVG